VAAEMNLAVLVETGVGRWGAAIAILPMQDGSAAPVDESVSPEPRPLANQDELESMIYALAAPLVELMGR
jgi:hypothetical protein